MKRARVMWLVALALAACTAQQKALWCRTVQTLDLVIRPAVSIALPFLAPSLASQWGMLNGAMNAAEGALRTACASGSDAGPALDTAAATAIDLLTWWTQHKADVLAASPPGTRDVRAPDESAQVLADLQAYQAKRGAR